MWIPDRPDDPLLGDGGAPPPHHGDGSHGKLSLGCHTSCHSCHCEAPPPHHGDDSHGKLSLSCHTSCQSCHCEAPHHGDDSHGIVINDPVSSF